MYEYARAGEPVSPNQDASNVLSLWCHGRGSRRVPAAVIQYFFFTNLHLVSRSTMPHFSCLLCHIRVARHW
jgi:hypothetical protein